MERSVKITDERLAELIEQYPKASIYNDFNCNVATALRELRVLRRGDALMHDPTNSYDWFDALATAERELGGGA